MKSIFNFIEAIISRPSGQRRLIMLSLDYVIIFISFILALYITKDSFFNLEYTDYTWMITLFIFLPFPIYYFTGQYRGIIRYLTGRSYYEIIGRNSLLIFLVIIYGYTLNNKIIPFQTLFISWLIINSLSGLSRLVIRDLIDLSNRKGVSTKTNVSIYGSETLGVQLIEAVQLTKYYNIKYIIEHEPSLVGRKIKGIPIISQLDFLNLLDNDIRQLWICIESLDNKVLDNILPYISKNKIELIKMPSLLDLVSFRSSKDFLKTIAIEDLLERDLVDADPKLLGKEVMNINILVTGAGGSIGMEICRQLIKQSAKKIILFERNEFSLYSIFNELLKFDLANIEIVPILGCATNKNLLKDIIKKYNINTIFHSAAYKHVPLVESNPLQGIYNNVFSTLCICLVSRELGINKVILISTDKAVRPTNVMGASKRLAELIFQYYSFKKDEEINTHESPSETVFSMVRFGNVLGSSGSVVPLFKEQIRNGGPITLTHSDVIRYFMTIEEAAQLVVQASSMARGGEIFLLDMGKPVKIYDLAIQMIQLSGLQVKDKDNPYGEIEIVYTGLRPGEKLFEELLTDNNPEKTNHPRIFKSIESNYVPDDFYDQLIILRNGIENLDTKLALLTLQKLVPEWKRSNTRIN